MKTTILFEALVLLFGTALMAGAMPAAAETLTWKIRSAYKYSVSVEFYARNRNHIWPGGGKVWVLRDSDTHTLKLSCRKDEWVCFGAWSRGNSSKYWGVGKNRRSSCNNCCYRCNGGTTDVRILKP